MDYPIHKCIFQGDIKSLSTLIRTHDIAEKDKHGNYLFIYFTSLQFLLVLKKL